MAAGWSRSSVTGWTVAVAVCAGLGAQERTAIVVNDTMVFPESLTSAADGTVWIGSSAKGGVYRAAPGAARAEPWIPAGTSGLQRVLGVLADERARTLWVCSSSGPAAEGRPAVPTSIKAFDLADGAFKASHEFAGGGGCNDMAVAADGTLYATDFGGGRVMRLDAGATGALEAWAADPRLMSVDGIALLGDGAVYVNTFRTGRLFRIPVQADGSAGAIATLETSRPLVRPDGMRTVGASTMLLAEGEERLVELVVTGDKADVRVLRDGFTGGPVAVTLVGQTAFVLEAKFAYRSDPTLKGQDPGPFGAVAVPYEKGGERRENS